MKCACKKKIKPPQKFHDGLIIYFPVLGYISDVWILRISILDCSFCKVISIFLSNLPGRRSAGSRTSGLLVAIIIFTWYIVSQVSEHILIAQKRQINLLEIKNTRDDFIF